jgi:(3,5-dihydroxyphenyl)acetyl-CoA 1,2-dioxygenase
MSLKRLQTMQKKLCGNSTRDLRKVGPDQMDAALSRVVDGLTNAGIVSAVANRRAFRVAQEPIGMFLNYAAVFAREQAYCHFSPALILNLERHWNAQDRRP